MGLSFGKARRGRRMAIGGCAGDDEKCRRHGAAWNDSHCLDCSQPVAETKGGLPVVGHGVACDMVEFNEEKVHPKRPMRPAP
jgi:hypothetical protein